MEAQLDHQRSERARDRAEARAQVLLQARRERYAAVVDALAKVKDSASKWYWARERLEAKHPDQDWANTPPLVSDLFGAIARQNREKFGEDVEGPWAFLHPGEVTNPLWLDAREMLNARSETQVHVFAAIKTAASQLLLIAPPDVAGVIPNWVSIPATTATLDEVEAFRSAMGDMFSNFVVAARKDLGGNVTLPDLSCPASSTTR